MDQVRGRPLVSRTNSCAFLVNCPLLCNYGGGNRSSAYVARDLLLAHASLYSRWFERELASPLGGELLVVVRKYVWAVPSKIDDGG